MASPRNAVQYLELIANREDLENSLYAILITENGQLIRFDQLDMHPAMLVQIQKILISEGVMIKNKEDVVIVNGERAKDFLDTVEVVKYSRDYKWLPKVHEPQLFASPPELIPRALAADIDDIRSLLVKLVNEARNSLIILSPYTTPAALRDILQPLYVNGQGANISVDIYIANSLNDAKRQAKALRTLLLDKPIENLRFYYKTGDLHEDSILHAKLLIADKCRGYLGSANFTNQGLSKHFELGVELKSRQSGLVVDMLDQLVLKNIFQPLI